MNESKTKNDPYGREQSPFPPVKPKVFSPLRPFRLLILFWFGSLAYFLFNWSISGGKDHRPDIFPIQLVGILIITCVLSLTCIPLGWWGICFPIGFWALQLYVYFSFHLGDEECFELLKEKLNR